MEAWTEGLWAPLSAATLPQVRAEIGCSAAGQLLARAFAQLCTDIRRSAAGQLVVLALALLRNALDCIALPH